MAKDNGGVIGVLNTPTTSLASGVWALMSEYQARTTSTWPSPFNLGSSSARFNSGSSDYLNRTPTTGNYQIATFSCWLKRSVLSTEQHFFVFKNTGSGDTYQFQLAFGSDNTLFFQSYNSGVQFNLTTSQVFRDTSAWYHIVGAVDTTQATNTNRVKLYVNGTQVTSLSTATYPSQNANLQMNGNNVNINYLGYYGAYGYYFNGYMSEVYWIDGTQLTPSSFGQTDTTTGIWIPKAYTGTYGTNGFYLKFSNAASLGTDSSGNGNNFTANNLTSADQTKDTPTNNWATWNPLFYYGNQTFTEGNLQIATGTSGASIGTIAVNTGKWYWECKVISTISTARIAGIFQVLGTNTDLSSTGAAYYNADGQKSINGTASAYGASLTTNYIVGVAIDVDNRSVTFYKNGTSQGAISLTSVFNVGDYITACLVQSGGSSQTVNISFGQPSYSVSGGYSDANGYGNFTYQPPSGYLSLCTNNLASNG
jgi:hypothetical protein